MIRALFLIPFACFLLYINAFSGGFHYDDIHSIVDNHYIRSFSNVLGFFLNPDFFSHDPAKSMYRPVLLVTYALNYDDWKGECRKDSQTFPLQKAINAILSTESLVSF